MPELGADKAAELDAIIADWRATDLLSLQREAYQGTQALPKSVRKIAVLEERANLCLPMFHANDIKRRPKRSRKVAMRCERSVKLCLSKSEVEDALHATP
jgi:hypothetical protein